MIYIPRTGRAAHDARSAARMRREERDCLTRCLADGLDVVAVTSDPATARRAIDKGHADWVVVARETHALDLLPQVLVARSSRGMLAAVVVPVVWLWDQWRNRIGRTSAVATGTVAAGIAAVVIGLATPNGNTAGPADQGMALPPTASVAVAQPSADERQHSPTPTFDLVADEEITTPPPPTPGPVTTGPAVPSSAPPTSPPPATKSASSPPLLPSASPPSPSPSPPASVAPSPSGPSHSPPPGDDPDDPDEWHLLCVELLNLRLCVL